MSTRGIHISEPAHLSLRHACLCLERNEHEAVTLPLEDINHIILDTDQVSLTATLLAACAEQGCLVVTCNKRHMPNGTLLPFHTFYKQHEMVHAQVQFSQPKKKRLWQLIIQHKIRNQATCLTLLGKNKTVASEVAGLVAKVKSGDTDNVEAHAARLYFGVYREGFLRDYKGEDRLNALLNYGYALVRAVIARNLAAFGFIPSLGVHHRSMGNAFNLVDDMIEPWRPFVDAYAMDIFLSTNAESLCKEDRQALAGIFTHQVLFAEGECGLLQALQKQAEQLRQHYLGGGMPNFPDFAVRGQVCQQME